MTKIKVKLRLSRVAGKPGTVFYQLSHAKKVKQITTHIHLLPEQWNEVAERVKDISVQDSPRLSALQRVIDDDVSLLRQLIQSYEVQGKEFSLHDIAEAFHDTRGKSSVLVYIRRLIKELSDKGREGTARNYQCVLSSFTKFLHDKDIPFSLLNDPLIQEYDDWLKTSGVTRNSSSFYMRNLRSMYNQAVCQQNLHQALPFKNVYTGVDKTCKRAINEQVLADLLQLDVSAKSRLVFARDLFMFSYCTRGMAFVDIAYLCKSNIKNGYICYTRRKSGQQLQVRIEAYVQDIIDRYADATKDLPYVFPIIRVQESKKAYSQYQTGLRYYNKSLKMLADLMDYKVNLSSYTSRHSWASIARNHNVPLSIISEGMGHSSDRITQIYLDSLDNSLIDDANSQIISSLKRCAEKGKKSVKKKTKSTLSK